MSVSSISSIYWPKWTSNFPNTIFYLTLKRNKASLDITSDCSGGLQSTHPTIPNWARKVREMDEEVCPGLSQSVLVCSGLSHSSLSRSLLVCSSLSWFGWLTKTWQVDCSECDIWYHSFRKYSIFINISHELSDMIMGWFIRLKKWSGFLAEEGRTEEGTIRGSRWPKKRVVLVINSF